MYIVHSYFFLSVDLLRYTDCAMLFLWFCLSISRFGCCGSETWSCHDNDTNRVICWSNDLVFNIVLQLTHCDFLLLLLTIAILNVIFMFQGVIRSIFDFSLSELTYFVINYLLNVTNWLSCNNKASAAEWDYQVNFLNFEKTQLTHPLIDNLSCHLLVPTQPLQSWPSARHQGPFRMCKLARSLNAWQLAEKPRERELDPHSLPETKEVSCAFSPHRATDSVQQRLGEDEQARRSAEGQ